MSCTAGVGKTTIAESVAARNKMTRIDIAAMVKENDLHEVRVLDVEQLIAMIRLSSSSFFLKKKQQQSHDDDCLARVWISGVGRGA